MKSAILFVTTLLLATPAYSQATYDVSRADEEPIPYLWRDIELGISKAEFKKIYPSNRAILYEDCKVEVVGNFKDGSLYQMTFRHNGKSATCLKKLETELTEKYGEVRSSEIRSQPTISGRLLFYHYKYWYRDPITATLASFTATSFQATFGVPKSQL